ncbi:MAG TPA: Gfo/Idh/MocA family oxidoreductase [Clostridia bacterium]
MNIAIIGYGGMGRYHFERVQKNGYLNVIGIYDIDQERCNIALRDGLKVYKSYQEIALDNNIEGVLIATPNDVHAFYIEYFAKKGLKVLCEKPVVRNAQEFEELLNKTGQSVFAINQNRRFDADYITARKIIQSEKIGKINRIQSSVTGANGVPGGWRKLIEHGGGMMLDWGVHLIDQICCIYPKFSALRCTYSYVLGFDVEDGFVADLFTNDGVQITIEVQTNDFIGADRWKIFGRDGSAVIKNWDLEGNIILPVYNSQAEIVSIQAGNGLTKTMAYRSHNSVEVLPLPKVEADCEAIYRNFAEAKSNDDLIVRHEEALRVLKIMDKCKQSAQKGGQLIEVEL